MDHDDQTREIAAAARSVKMLAGAALIVALTGPLWVPKILATVNFRSAADIAAERNRADIEALREQAASADQRVKAAEAVVAKLKDDLGKMEGRLDGMRAALATGAAIELAGALRAESRFQSELAAFQGVATPPPDIADMLKAVTPFADKGVPTAQEVRGHFQDQLYQGVSGGVALAWLRRTVSFGGADPAPEINPHLLEAETRLRDDDLPGAMAAARRVEAERPAWLDAWLAEAGARASADTLIPRLYHWGNK